MASSEVSQRIQQALARGEIDECLDEFDAAWHGSVIPSITKWIAQLALPHDLALKQSLISELIKIDLEQRWRRSCEKSLVVQAPLNSNHFSDLPDQAQLDDYQRALAAVWPFPQLPGDLLAEEYRVRQLWGDKPDQATYEQRCAAELWPELRKLLSQVDADIRRRLSGSAGRDNPASQSINLSTDKTLEPAAADSLPGEPKVGDEIDDFRLLNVLGEGAFAKVFLAEQKSLQRLVALKITRHRTLESPVLSQLDHPNIVRVYDERIVGALTLMYMQFVPGDNMRWMVDLRRQATRPLTSTDYFRSLSEALETKGIAPSRRIIESTRQHLEWGELIAWLGSRLYSALAHAHSCGIFHRDVKPENVLVTADGEPMLLDFNLSFGQHLDGSTIEESFGGSLAYMSPEQLSSLLGQSPVSNVGAASDVYSLGIVLHELLLGYRPLEGDGASAQSATPSVTQSVTPFDNRPESFLQRRSQPALWLAKEARLPQGLRENLQAALHPDPAGRPTAFQLARRLSAYEDPELRQIYYPKDNGWNTWIARHPMRGLIAFGLLPNAAVSALNIWANDRLTTHNFDRAFFDKVEKPWVNLVAYTAGILGALLILTPVLRHLNRVDLSQAERHSLARQTLMTPLYSSLLILFLWLASGLAFPLWNQSSPHSAVGPQDIAGFLISQLIHGLIAAVSTFVITSRIVSASILPKYYTADSPCLPASRFAASAAALRWASSIMAVTPLLAVFALAVSDQFDRTVFVVLAMVGFMTHLFTSAFVPTVITKLEALAKLATEAKESRQ